MHIQSETLWILLVGLVVASVLKQNNPRKKKSFKVRRSDDCLVENVHVVERVKEPEKMNQVTFLADIGPLNC